MKKNIPLLLIAVCIFSMSCNMSTPENYFDYTVLSSNQYVSFAGEGEARQLASPPATMGKDGAIVAMKSKDALDQKIGFIEDNYNKLKDLKETDETRELIQTAIAMYEYILPVYKTEYAQLAKAYDEKASQEWIVSLTKQIHDKYFNHYNELYEKLISLGKVYAQKHSIEVKWNVGA